MVILTTASDTNSTMSARLGVGVGAGVGVNVGVTTGSNFGDGAGSGVGDGVGGGAGVAMATRVEVTSGVGDAVGEMVLTTSDEDSVVAVGTGGEVGGVFDAQDVKSSPTIARVITHRETGRSLERSIHLQGALNYDDSTISHSIILQLPPCGLTNIVPGVLKQVGCCLGRGNHGGNGGESLAHPLGNHGVHRGPNWGETGRAGTGSAAPGWGKTGRSRQE